MPALDGFTYSGGTAPVTASLTNALAGSGGRATKTEGTFSEAMLMGLSGGATFGYFTFAYKGYDPQVALLTRNTFNNYGWDTITERLGITQDVMHSTSPDKAREKLVMLLEEGRVPIVWADVFTLGYETSAYDDMWMMCPVIVSEYEPGGQAVVHDRSQRPLAVDADVLDEARAKVKKDKHRIVTIDLPESPNLSEPVRAALADCLALYDGNPPVGSGKNFGIGGYGTWIERLSKAAAKESWAKLFSPGRNLFAGLTSAYESGLLHWEDDTRTADRELFASFLEEAAEVLEEKSLLEPAVHFREAGRQWAKLGEVLLPEEIPVLKEARELMQSRHEAFRARGMDAGDELTRCDTRLKELGDESEESLTDPEVANELLEHVAEAVAAIRETEQNAVESLREALA